jgi:hypothetical protein
MNLDGLQSTLLQEMKTWLMLLLKTVEKYPPEEHEKQLTVAFFIILCLKKSLLLHYQNLSDSDVLLLTKVITLNPEPEKRSCPGYDFLKSCLLDERYVHVLAYCFSHKFNIYSYIHASY